ncbi:ankyrin repeat protein [Faustovirus]|nr:ankyrin repeat protein [Faustovirus]
MSGYIICKYPFYDGELLYKYLSHYDYNNIKLIVKIYTDLGFRLTLPSFDDINEIFYEVFDPYKKLKNYDNKIKVAKLCIKMINLKWIDREDIDKYIFENIFKFMIKHALYDELKSFRYFDVIYGINLYDEYYCGRIYARMPSKMITGIKIIINVGILDVSLISSERLYDIINDCVIYGDIPLLKLLKSRLYDISCDDNIECLDGCCDYVFTNTPTLQQYETLKYLIKHTYPIISDRNDIAWLISCLAIYFADINMIKHLNNIGLFNMDCIGSDWHPIAYILETNKSINHEVFQYIFKHTYVNKSQTNRIVKKLAGSDVKLITWLIKTKRIDNVLVYKTFVAACESGLYESASKLIKYCDPSGGGDNDAICYAARNGHIKIVKLLLYHSCVDPSVDYNYALGKSFEREHYDIVRLLMKHPKVIEKKYCVADGVVYEIYNGKLHIHNVD